MRRSFTNILCDDPSGTAEFYESVLSMSRHADFGWFIILSHSEMPHLEFGLLDKRHESVPADIAKDPSGFIVTFVVADVDMCLRQAQEIGAPVIEMPRNMPYGQRRMLLRDPAGTVVDISSPIID